MYNPPFQDVRTLSSKALNELALLDSDYAHETIIPTLLDKALDLDVATRHGAILGLAEIIDATSRNEEQRQMLLSTSGTVEKLINVVPEIERRRLYRGRGGELVRGGVCHLVECLAKACVPLSVKDQVRLLDAIDANIPHPSEAIQETACRSIGSLLATYFPVGPNGPSPRLQSRVVDKFVTMASTSDNPAVTRGYSLALGYLPAKLLAPSRDNLLKVFICLKNLADPAATVGGEGDAETRRNALTAMGRIVTTVGFFPCEPRAKESEHSHPHVILDNALIESVFQTYLSSLSDYRTDRRGDVGSWCRMEAMSCATALLLQLSASDATLSMISCEVVSGVVCAALRQVAEKLDAVRDRCSACLEELLLCTRITIIQRKKLLEIPCKVKIDQTWRDAVKPYTEVIKCAEISDYTDAIILGFTASIGGLGESQSRAAWVALLDWIRTQDLALVQRIGHCLLKILDQNGGRLFVPALVTLDRLLSHRCLHDLIDQTDFCGACVPRLISASATTNSVPRILAAVDTMISLASVCDAERHSSELNLIFGCLCRLLVHPIPRVRKLVADSFYLLLVDLNHAEAAEQVVGMSWMTPSVEKTEQIAGSLNVIFPS
jgi:tubulin-specific chaperone D